VRGGKKGLEPSVKTERFLAIKDVGGNRPMKKNIGEEDLCSVMLQRSGAKGAGEEGGTWEGGLGNWSLLFVMPGRKDSRPNNQNLKLSGFTCATCFYSPKRTLQKISSDLTEVTQLLSTGSRANITTKLLEDKGRKYHLAEKWLGNE